MRMRLRLRKSQILRLLLRLDKNRKS